ncbi:MAG TPA: hypothetical protein VFV63_09680, partial [Ilumatobacteraceae bacterium]|nr:hypothetical protein [Ilumatobacteraceae bacterium]
MTDLSTPPELAKRCRSEPWIARIRHDWALSLGGNDELLMQARESAQRLGMQALLASCDRAITDRRPGCYSRRP